MRALTEAEYLTIASVAFSKIFRSEDPFDEPFQDEIEERELLWPVYYDLTDGDPGDKLLTAIIDAARTIGDSEVFFSVLERPPASEQNRPYHWVIPLMELPTYRQLSYPLVLENTLYSPKGLWGIMVSQEEHALVGGTRPFMTAFRSKYPRVKTGVESFIELLKERKEQFNFDTRWVCKLLAHIYGAEVARKLLAGTGLIGAGPD